MIQFTVRTLEEFNEFLEILKDNGVVGIEIGDFKLAFNEQETVSISQGQEVPNSDEPETGFNANPYDRVKFKELK